MSDAAHHTSDPDTAIDCGSRRGPSRRRRREPYGWLGVSALGLGVGAALATGSGLAHADTTAGGTATATGNATGHTSAAGRPGGHTARQQTAKAAGAAAVNSRKKAQKTSIR